MKAIKNTVGFTLAIALVSWPMITDIALGTHFSVGYAIFLMVMGYVIKFTYNKRC